MSGGLRHHNDEVKRAEPCGWTQNHPRRIGTHSKGTSASALTPKVCQNDATNTPKSLDTVGVVRDVEKLLPAKFAEIKSRQEAL
jgi:hypothetical protein